MAYPLSVLHKPAQVLMICVLLGGCTKMDSMIKNVTLGAAVGAGIGALGLLASGGCVGCGAAIGGAVGAGMGAAFDALENKR